MYFITFEAIQNKSILQNKLNIRNRTFSNFNPSNDSQSESLWFKCSVNAPFKPPSGYNRWLGIKESYIT